MKRIIYLMVILLGILLMASCNPEPQTFTITFNSNGGSGEMGSQTATEGEPASLSENSFTRQYYEFAGWATSAGGEKLYDDAQSITLSGDLTLYAVWKEAPYIGTWIYPVFLPSVYMSFTFTTGGRFSRCEVGGGFFPDQSAEGDYHVDENGYLVLEYDESDFRLAVNYIFLKDNMFSHNPVINCIEFNSGDSYTGENLRYCHVDSTGGGVVLTHDDELFFQGNFEEFKQYAVELFRYETDDLFSPSRAAVNEVKVYHDAEGGLINKLEYSFIANVDTSVADQDLIGRLDGIVYSLYRITMKYEYEKSGGTETLTIYHPVAGKTGYECTKQQ